MTVFRHQASAPSDLWRRWRADRGSRAVIGIAVLLAVYLAWQIFGWGGPTHRETIGDAAFWPVNVTSLVLALRVARAKPFRPEVRRAWLFIGLGLLAYLVGSIMQFYYEAVLHTRPYPTYADVSYLAFYPLLLVGIWQLPRARVQGFAIIRVVLDAAAMVVAGAAAVWYVTLASATESGGTLLALVVSVAYPCGDLILVMALTALAVRTRRLLGSWALTLVKASLVLYILSDIIYGRMALEGTYAGGSWLDTGYIFALAMLGAAANEQFRVATSGLSPGEARHSEGGFFFLPFVATTVTFGFAVVSSRSDGRLEFGSLALLGAALVIALARLHWSTLDSRRNYQAAERTRSEFFATVSHELRTPLTSIRGFCELLAESDDVTGEARDFVRIVQRNAMREERIVADLLFLSSTDFLQHMETTETDLVQIVGDAVGSNAPIADETEIALHWEPPDHEVLVHVDPQRMGQVIDNLLTNAIKFSDRGAPVRVSIDVTSTTASVRVRDSGPGVPEDERDRIFDRLYRGQFAHENVIPGAGLGLPIAREIVEAFHGSISLEAHEEPGAVFRIDLPAVGVRPAAPPSNSPATAVDSSAR